jgi:hypothetical protein
MPSTTVGQISVQLRGVQADRIYLEPIFKDESVMDIFMVMPNVPYRRKMLFAGQLDDFLRQKTGCGFKPIGKLPMTERCVETTMVTGEIEQCFDEFVDTALMELLRKGNEIGDLNGTVLANILMDRMRLGTERQINKLAFFGDKNSADESQNIVDGLWTVYIPQLVAQNQVVRVDSNSGQPLGSGDAIDLLDEVFEAASNELKAFDINQRRLIVSNNVFEQLTKDIRDGAANSCCFVEELENGRTAIRFRGVQVVPMFRWQELASQYMTGIIPNVGNDANLVLYTVPSNLVLATDLINSVTSIDMWHEKLEEKTYARVCFKLGFNYLHPSLMTVAF